MSRVGFGAGVLRAIPLAITYLAYGIPLGILGVQSGLPAWAMILMSTLVLGGASQYVCLQLLAVGAGIGDIILATFVVNLRHLILLRSS